MHKQSMCNVRTNTKSGNILNTFRCLSARCKGSLGRSRTYLENTDIEERRVRGRRGRSKSTQGTVLVQNYSLQLHSSFNSKNIS